LFYASLFSTRTTMRSLSTTQKNTILSQLDAGHSSGWSILECAWKEKWPQLDLVISSKVKEHTLISLISINIDQVVVHKQLLPCLTSLGISSASYPASIEAGALSPPSYKPLLLDRFAEGEVNNSGRELMHWLMLGANLDASTALEIVVCINVTSWCKKWIASPSQRPLCRFWLEIGTQSCDGC
jgi:hypothetical protein